MSTAKRTIAASEFKARCLELLDEVARTRVPVIVTKRGKAVARLMPLESELSMSLEGSVRYGGDIVAPVDDEWDADA